MVLKLRRLSRSIALSRRSVENKTSLSTLVNQIPLISLLKGGFGGLSGVGIVFIVLVVGFRRDASEVDLTVLALTIALLLVCANVHRGKLNIKAIAKPRNVKAKKRSRACQFISQDAE